MCQYLVRSKGNGNSSEKRPDAELGFGQFRQRQNRTQTVVKGLILQEERGEEKDTYIYLGGLALLVKHKLGRGAHKQPLKHPQWCPGCSLDTLGR